MSGWQDNVAGVERRAAVVLARLVDARGHVAASALVSEAPEFSAGPAAAAELDGAIARLRSFGLDIEWSGGENPSAAIGTSSWQHRPVSLDDEDLALLRRSMEIAAPLDGPTSEALAALMTGAPAVESDATVSLSPRGSAAHGRSHAYSRLHRLAGLRERRIVAGFGYPDASGDYAPRTLQIMGLGESRGVWYAVGVEPGSDTVRAFAVSRMRGPVAELGDEGAYGIPEDFDLSEHLALSWRLGPDPFPATVWFDPDVAGFVSTVLAHIPTEVEEDGSLEMTVTVGDVDGFIGWVISFGTHARITEPDALADMAGEVLEGVAARHA